MERNEMKILKLPRPATVQDLLDLDEKAGIVHGQIVLMGGNGLRTNRPAALIWMSLYHYECANGGGCAVADKGVFIVDLPHRQSFGPDAAWYVGSGTDPVFDGAPLFAAEVRSPGDYGLRAERAMAAKRTEYFAAGTRVVWD